MNVEQMQQVSLNPEASGDVYVEPEQTTSKELLGHDRRQTTLQKRKQLKNDLELNALGERSASSDLNRLMQQCLEPQPPVTKKDVAGLQLNEAQAQILTDQVRKMKTGMERLQAIIRKFNCTERFKKDVEFIIANVGPAIAKAEKSRQARRKD